VVQLKLYVNYNKAWIHITLESTNEVLFKHFCQISYDVYDNINYDLVLKSENTFCLEVSLCILLNVCIENITCFDYFF
jgi:hypothetical protein